MSAVPFKVKAVFEYKSEEPDDLTFDNGQIITVTEAEDEDWYTGEYTSSSGEKVEGIFPRNFVEKYEPAIPSRPVRAPKRSTAPESAAPPPTELQHTTEPEPVNVAREAEPELPKQSVVSLTEEKVVSPPATALEEAPTATAQAPPQASKPLSPKSGPPVAEKPSSNSFRDRIAAFNKPAAAPITPFKPAGQSGSNFIKKPFVAPPPSKNAYVPPPRDIPPPKVYRREEDPNFTREGEGEERQAEVPQPQSEAPAEDEPKVTSLKERIALLQKQQLEQASRHAEAAQKKERPKKPTKKRTESSEQIEQVVPVPEAPLERMATNETVGKRSLDPADEESDLPHSQTERPAGPPSVQPSRELVSDTNDADDSGAGDTEDVLDVSTEEERPKQKPAASRVERVDDKEEDEEDAEEDEEEEEEEEEEDPEIRRKRELRERMAKMSGGMGMMGMFGPPGGLPPTGARKPRAAPELIRQSSDLKDQEEPAPRAPPVQIMALPGMSNTLPRRPEAEDSEDDSADEAEATPQEPSRQEEATDDYIAQPPRRVFTDRSEGGRERAVPPPPPREARAVPPTPQSPAARPIPPPPPPTAEDVQRRGMTSDDKLSEATEHAPDDSSSVPVGIPPPLPSQTRPAVSTIDTNEPATPLSTERRTSRAPPPIPLTSPTTASPQTRAPPPPPPGPPSRRSTADGKSFTATPQYAGEEDESDVEVTEYDGDYDTDIASSAKHKDALKSHNRDSSYDDATLTDDGTTKAPSSPPSRMVPPIPTTVPYEAPPPPPPAAPPKSRKSVDAPRAAPPPVPPPKAAPTDEEDYDPYRYNAPQHGLPSPPIRTVYSPVLQSPQEEREIDDLYGSTSQPSRPPPPPIERAAPPPPPPTNETQRGSFELKRSSTAGRRSMDQSRPSGEHGYIASDIDLAQGSQWWTNENALPPALQGRPDILFETEASSSTKRGGKTTIVKDIYILFIDYSQTTINVNYDQSDPSHVSLEQNHQRPPPPPRQDQLESASEAYGAQIAKVAAGSSGGTVGDGSAPTFVLELVKPLNTALKPVGTRAYGALVYANLANASTQQFDEIRPGDIVTFRNAKFSGHKGNLHQKYSLEAGKPDHVGVVIDWDGTKKKIRAWEQGREEKGKKTKVREESYRMGDLKSGEVRVWRVMPRKWVGWE